MNGLVKSIATLTILVGSVGMGTSGEVDDLTLTDVQRLIKERGYSWTAGHTGVSDLTAAAKRDLAGLVMPPDADRLEASVPLLTAPAKLDLPERWDWREAEPGVHPVGVTPVKDQGTCGSCWAFAAAAQLESHVRIVDGIEEDLSEQQLVSCNHNGGSCAGGWHLDAYSVFMAPGAVSEICFPYENTNAPCTHWDCSSVARIAGYSRVANDVRSIKHAVMTGPVFVGINWQEMFAFYKSGVYDVPAADPPRWPITSHAVVIVGWDDSIEHSLGTGAWIIKNSWGADWGMEGYAYVSFASRFLESGPRQLDYLPDSSSRLVLDEPQGGQTWIVGTPQTVSWLTDLAANQFEVGYLIGGQYQVVDDAVPASTTHFDFNAPGSRADDLVVRVTALAADGTTLATAETGAPIYLVPQRVAWPTDGVIVQDGTGTKRPHALVADGEEGCFLVWKSGGNNYITRMSALGESVWSAPRMLPGGAGTFSAVSDDAGGVYLAYSSATDGSDVVRLIRIAADGTTPWGTVGMRVDQFSGEFPTGHSVRPLLARDGSGGVICVWAFYAASFNTVYGQRIDAGGVKRWDAGSAPGRRLTERPGAGPCALTRLAGGAVAFAFTAFGDGSFDRTDLWVQLVRDSGTLPWGEMGRLTRTAEGTTADQALASDPTGGVAVAWRESGVGWSRVHLQRFAAAGVATWSEGGLLVDGLETAGQLHLELVADETGGYLMAIAKESSFAEFEVSVHRVAPDGNWIWPPGGIPVTRKAGMIGYPGVDAPLAADGAGGAIVFWADFDAEVSDGRVGLSAQHVTADGTLDWTPYGEPIVLSRGVSVRIPKACRDRAGNVSLAWVYDYPEPSIHFQRIAGSFPAPPRCEITAWLRRDGELQPLADAVMHGCPDGDADALVITCDFVDADMAGVPAVPPADLGLDTSGLGVSLGVVTTADVAGTPVNGYRVTLVRDRVLGCSGCVGDGCDDGAVAQGPLPVTYQGITVGAVPDMVVHGLDVNGDGSVNLVEIVGLVRTFGRQHGDPQFDGCYDISGDGLVDIADWNLLAEHYGAAASVSTTMLSMRRISADAGEIGSQVYEVIVTGAGAQATVLRLEPRGAPAASLVWRADSPAAAESVLLPVQHDGAAEAWLVLPRLDRARGAETTLGRLILPGALPADAPDRLRLAGGELLLTGGRIVALAGGGSAGSVGGVGKLAAPFPNPCNPSTTITYTAPPDVSVALKIYDVTGRLVRTLVEESVRGESGSRRVVWAGRDQADRPVASGVYFVRLSVDEEVSTRRLVLIR